MKNDAKKRTWPDSEHWTIEDDVRMLKRLKKLVDAIPPKARERLALYLKEILGGAA